MASGNSCDISYEQMTLIDNYFLKVREDMSWVMRNLLEKLIDQPVMIAERTLIIVNSYNEIHGIVRHVNGYMVQLSDCNGINQYGEHVEGYREYDINRIRLYHPAMLAFFKLIDNDIQDQT